MHARRSGNGNRCTQAKDRLCCAAPPCHYLECSARRCIVKSPVGHAQYKSNQEDGFLCFNKCCDAVRMCNARSGTLSISFSLIPDFLCDLTIAPTCGFHRDPVHWKVIRLGKFQQREFHQESKEQQRDISFSRRSRRLMEQPD